ncbi:21227_t:CDS:1, partial [Entrophospora sp. SA101]
HLVAQRLPQWQIPSLSNSISRLCQLLFTFSICTHFPDEITFLRRGKQAIFTTK